MTAPRRLSDRYELRELIGLGGMSEVHLARDLRLHRDVAIKILRADLSRDTSLNLRFLREARDAASLNHPAIAAVYDTDEMQTPSGPLLYIVMEHVDGLTLRDVVATQGPMQARRAIEVVAQACEALNYSHQRGIVHRDVKPANIMIGTANSVKVVDFGIAKAVADSGREVTQTGAVLGTAQYLSPEQARGDRVDARADVYSLGCVLYEICTGEPPFTGDTPVAVAYQHVRQDPVAPSRRYSGISPDLDAVVLKAMAKNPDNRYQTAAEMHTDLERLQRGLTPYASQGMAGVAGPLEAATSDPLDGNSAPSRRRQSDRRGRERGWSTKRRLLAVAALAALVIVGTIGFDFVEGHPPHSTVPDVHGQASADAVTFLQNGGFKTRVQSSTDSTVAPGLVINTDPVVDSAVDAGEEITLNVSTGPGPSGDPTESTAPAQLTVPDVSSLTYAEAVRMLTEAGFGRFQQAWVPSPPELKDRVIGTNPLANRTIASTDEITLVLGSGPATPGN